MSVVFLFLFLKKYKNDLSSYKNVLHLPEIKSGPGIKCQRWGFLVNRSIALLFSRKIPSFVFEFALPLSAIAISLTYSCLWWSDCWLELKKHAVTLCHLIYIMWIFDFAHYALSLSCYKGQQFWRSIVFQQSFIFCGILICVWVVVIDYFAII